MTKEQTISWIFMAIGMSSNKEAVDVNGISMVADAINHAVPNPDELRTSIKWLIERDFLVKIGQKYKLTEKGQSEFEKAYKLSGRFAIWERLEKVVKNYA